MIKSLEDFENKTNAMHALSEYCNLYSYDPSTGCFAMQDGSLGMAFEAEMAATTMASGDGLDQLSRQVSTALSRYPDLAIGQIILIPDHNINDDLEAYASHGGCNHPVLASLREQTSEFFRQQTKSSNLYVNNAEFRCKRFRGLVTVSIRPDAVAGGAVRAAYDSLVEDEDVGDVNEATRRIQKEGPSSGSKEQSKKAGGLFGVLGKVVHSVSGLFTGRMREGRSNPGYMRFMRMRTLMEKRLNEVGGRLQNSFGGAGVRLHRCNAEDVIAFYRQMIWPKTATKYRINYDPCVPIFKQIPLGDLIVRENYGEVGTAPLEDTIHRVAVLAQLPEETIPGQVSYPHERLGWLSPLSYLNDGFVCLNFATYPRASLRSILDKRERDLRGGMSTKGRVERWANDLRIARDYSENQDRMFFTVSLSVGAYGTSGREAQNNLETIRDRFDEIGLSMRVDNHYGPSSFFQSLPFGYVFAPGKVTNPIAFKVPDLAISDLMPLYGCWRGTPNATVLLQNRLGELFRFDPFDSDTAAHMFIAGQTGSGKSFFMSNFLLNFLCYEKDDSFTQAFVLDKGESYSPLVAVLGDAGSYNKMSSTSKTCINVFSGTMATSATFLYNFLGFCVTRDENKKLDRDSENIVSEVVSRTFRENQEDRIFNCSYESLCANPDGTRRNGVWVHWARKRTPIRYMDVASVRQFDSIRQRNDGMDAQFEVYYVAKITGYADRAENKSALPQAVRSLKDLGASGRKWLESRSFIVTTDQQNWYSTKATSEGTPLVLYTSREKERGLALGGYEFEHIEKFLIVDVATTQDLKDLVQAGAEIIYSQDYYDRAAIKVRQEHDFSEYQGASQEAIDQIIGDLVDQLDAGFYFEDFLSGEATLQQECVFSDFARVLEEYYHELIASAKHNPAFVRQSEIARNLMGSFSDFHGDGVYAGFFDGPTGFVLEGKKIVCFELGELKSGGLFLMASVVSALLQMLTIYFLREDVRFVRKMLVMDEFWELLSVPAIADKVVNLARTARKYTTALCPLTQHVTDLTKTEAGRAILSSCPHRFILRQSSDVVKQLGDLLDYSDEAVFWQYHVHSRKGLFSEAMFCDENRAIKEIVRLVPVPLLYWLCTTDGADQKYRESRRNHYRGLNIPNNEAMMRALIDCSRSHPYGMKHRKV